MKSASLYGIKYSNRDFSQAETWGKNQFNSYFPIALVNYLDSKKLENIYLVLDDKLNVTHKTIKAEELYGINRKSNDLFYSFESPYTPYQKLVIGNLPRVDIVTQSQAKGHCLAPLEIKLTALPDNSTCDLSEKEFSTEIVIRPDTIVYLAYSIANLFKEKQHRNLQSLLGKRVNQIKDWTEGFEVIPYIKDMILSLDEVILSIIDKQTPILLQPVWKTEGKSPQLSENCLDVFVWSNLAFSQLFIDAGRNEIKGSKITRQIRTIIWLFKMLYDYAHKGQINYTKIIDELSYNTKNDKAFAVSGKTTHKYLACPELIKPRIKKKEIKNIILGGGQKLLSPERRFDAIIYNSPELFK